MTRIPLSEKEAFDLKRISPVPARPTEKHEILDEALHSR